MVSPPKNLEPSHNHHLFLLGTKGSHLIYSHCSIRKLPKCKQCIYYENNACISIAEASADKEPYHMATEADRVSAFREMHRTHTNDKCEALAYCSLVTKCKYKWTYSTLSLKIDRLFIEFLSQSIFQFSMSIWNKRFFLSIDPVRLIFSLTN